MLNFQNQKLFRLLLLLTAFSGIPLVKSFSELNGDFGLTKSTLNIDSEVDVLLADAYRSHVVKSFQ